ncbi:MAG: hypothetical protein NZM28_10910 [Fimbriimonadales bacterium]|nr:hypothetical protein [Fimbriimonadales bacterium]
MPLPDLPNWFVPEAHAVYNALRQELTAHIASAPHTLETAELMMTLGLPAQALASLRAPEADALPRPLKRLLQIRALHAMRLTEAAAQLAYHWLKGELPDDYELCLMLARLNYHLGLNTRSAEQAKRDIEAAVSTARHCIRLQPHNPCAYALLSRITAEYPHGQSLSEQMYRQLLHLTPDPPDDWRLTADAMWSCWLRQQTEPFEQWRAHLETLLRTPWNPIRTPYNPDHTAFLMLAEAYLRTDDRAAYERSLQIAFALYPTKASQLARRYLKRLRFGRFLQLMRYCFARSDKQEAQLRYAYLHADARARHGIILQSVGLERR